MMLLRRPACAQIGGGWVISRLRVIDMLRVLGELRELGMFGKLGELGMFSVLGELDLPGFRAVGATGTGTIIPGATGVGTAVLGGTAPGTVPWVAVLGTAVVRRSLTC